MKEYIILLTVIGFTSLSECFGRTKPMSGSSCWTPDGKSGICFNIRECESLREQLYSASKVPKIGDFLRKSVCGYEGSDPLVCCVDTMERMQRSGNFGTTTNDLYPRMISPPDCGLSNAAMPRIQGGVPATLGAWPWMVALGYRDRYRQKFQGYHCGGSLVSHRHVITAAHCLTHPSLTLYSVRLGDLDLNDTVNDGASPVDFFIQKALRHPSFSSGNRVNDIAVLHLKGEVQFNNLISPICLPKVDQVRTMNFEGYSPTVIGWGETKFNGPKSSHLLQVQVPVVSNQECNDDFASKERGSRVTSTEICAGYTEGKKDACRDDSGGPMMFYSQERYHLIGVVSYGFLCGEPGTPGVYARVTEHLQWINENLV